MADSTLNVTQPLDNPEKLLKIIDNGDGTYSVSIAGTVTGTFTLPTGAATSAKQDTQTAQLQGMNILSQDQWTSIKINYTDATKATVLNYQWYKGVTLVMTLTPTSDATSETYTKS